MRRRSAPPSALAGIAPFDRFTARELEPLHEHVDRLDVRSGTTVGHAGVLVREFLVVLRGEVWARQGNDVTVHGPGAQLGGEELLAGATHPATLEARTDVELLVVNGPAYRWAVQSLGVRAA